MRSVTVLVAALCISGTGTATDFDPFQGPKPLAVFIQSSPWAMVIGSDTPRVAIYENGDVIFAKGTGGNLNYHYVALGKQQLEDVRAQLKPVMALKELKSSYNLRPNASDQPEAKFYFRDGERAVVTSVYGLMVRDTKLPGYTEFPPSSTPTAPPGELIKLHTWLCELDFSNSAEWTPRYLQVLFWSYSYAPEASIHWPNDWPSLNSDRAIKHGDLHSVFLDGSMLSKLREFLATRRERGAVEIAGKKMTASYRFVFPGEREWRKAFAQVTQERLDSE